MADLGFDPCPADAPNVIDLGHGVRVRFSWLRGVRAGLTESHDKLGNVGRRCSGMLLFDLPEVRESGYADRPLWRVRSFEPLTIEPSVLCRTCGHHGFIRDGRWEPA